MAGYIDNSESEVEAVLVSGGDCGSLKEYPGLKKFLQSGGLGYFPSVEWDSNTDTVEPILFVKGERDHREIRIKYSHSREDIEQVLTQTGVTKIDEKEYQERRKEMVEKSKAKSKAFLEKERVAQK